MVSIADAIQPTLAVPTRRALARQQSSGQLHLTDAAHALVLAAARAEPLGQNMLVALAEQQAAIAAGTHTAARACKEAGATIDRILAEQYA